jgi:hypothetical protein
VSRGTHLPSSLGRWQSATAIVAVDAAVEIPGTATKACTGPLKDYAINIAFSPTNGCQHGQSQAGPAGSQAEVIVGRLPLTRDHAQPFRWAAGARPQHWVEQTLSGGVHAPTDIAPSYLQGRGAPPVSGASGEPRARLLLGPHLTAPRACFTDKRVGPIPAHNSPLIPE